MEESSRRDLPKAIRYGGTAFLLAWFLLFFSGEIWGLDYERAAESVALLSTVSIGSCFLGFAILNILGHKGILPVIRGRFFIFLGCVLALGTVGVSVGNLLPAAVFVVCCVLVGFCGSFFICAVILQLSQQSPRNALVTCGVVFLVGILVYSFAFYVPRMLTVIILCLLPIIAGLFFAFDKLLTIESAQRKAQDVTKEASEQGRAPIAWRAVILLSVFMLFSCVVRGYLPFSMDNESFSYTRSFSIILMLVMGSVVVIVPYLLPTRFTLSNLYRGILLAGVVFFALFPIFGMDNPVALVLSDAYRALCALITLTFFACMARHIPFFGYRNVGGGIVFYISFALIGWLVGTLLYYADLSADILRIFSSIQCVFVLLAFVLLYRQGDFVQFIDEQESDDQQAFAGDESGGRWKQRCLAIAKERGLTAREEEVFMLLAKGYKAQNISEKLSVSYNTTRAHIRNIYQKCDVHSQQEFVAMIESYE